MGRLNLGTPQQLDRFLQDVERRAYRMAFIACGNRDDALDIVQDAMIKLAQKYSDRQESEWGPLFYRIVQSTILDWYRREKVRHSWRALMKFTGVGKFASSDKMDKGDESRIGDPLEEGVAAPGDCPTTRLVNERSMVALDDALNRLPLRQQQAFLLRIWEGLSVEETAQAMNCSQGSVKTHFSRAVHTLRGQLEDHRL